MIKITCGPLDHKFLKGMKKVADNFSFSNGPTMELHIGDQMVVVTTYASVKDLELIEEKEIESVDFDKESKEIVLQIIRNHVTEKEVDFSNISSISDQELRRFVSEYVKNSDELDVSVSDIQDQDDICKVLVSALREYHRATSEKMKERFEPLMRSVNIANKLAISSIPKTAYQVPSFNISPQLLNISYNATRMMESIRAQISLPVLEMSQRLSESIRNMLPDYSSMFASITENLANIAKTLTIPELSEEAKERLRASYEAWGKFAWTLPPDAPIRMFRQAPESLKDANESMRKYIGEKSISECFTHMREMNIRKDDLEEAIADFNDKRYKSCAMILFGLIEGKLIRLQGRSDTWRKVGDKAAEEFYKKMSAKISDENGPFFYLLRVINVFSALQVIFANGDNFKKQPQILNRNFVDHGMLHRRVGRRDTVQLFYILYNLTGILIMV